MMDRMNEWQNKCRDDKPIIYQTNQSAKNLNQSTNT